MKVKELLDILSDADPNDNVAFYYLEKNVLNRGEFESFFDCMYEDIPQLKVSINSYIRSGQSLNADKLASDTGYSKNLFHLYNMIIEIKELLMEGITTTENVQCLFDAVPYEHEGYVMTNDYGTFKLIKRQQFSYANFNNRQFR